MTKRLVYWAAGSKKVMPTRHREQRPQRKLLKEIDAKKLALNKLIATQRAEALGHALGPWHHRQNDPLSRVNAFCKVCNMIAVAGVDASDPIAEPVYGHALMKECAGGRP